MFCHVCVWISRRALHCHRACEGVRSPQQFTLEKAASRIKNVFLRLTIPSESDSRHLRLTADYYTSPTSNYSASEPPLETQNASLYILECTTLVPSDLSPRTGFQLHRCVKSCRHTTLITEVFNIPMYTINSSE